MVVRNLAAAAVYSRSHIMPQTFQETTTEWWSHPETFLVSSVRNLRQRRYRL